MIKLAKITCIVPFVFTHLICLCANNDIHNVWLEEYELRSYFDNSYDTLYNRNLLLDFSNPNTGIAKRFLEPITNEITWNFNNGILIIDYEGLVIDSLRVVSLTPNHLVLSPILLERSKPKSVIEDMHVVHDVEFKDILYVYKKLKHVPINHDVAEASKILSNKIWIKDTLLNKKPSFYEWLEFMDNGASIQKFTNDSNYRVKLLEENWCIDSYKNNLFLIFYSTPIHGFYDFVYQIHDLNDSVLQFESYNNQMYKLMPKPLTKPSFTKSQLLGKWASKNDTNEYYGLRIPNSVNMSTCEKLYDGTLYYTFKKNKVHIKGEGINMQRKWYLNSDQTVLILEHQVNYRFIKGIKIQYSSIINFNTDQFTIELFDNEIWTEKKKPVKINLNRIQEFKQVDK